MERDAVMLIIVALIIISTHTLTWSVTWHKHYYLVFKVISTHTLTWSVTKHI